MDELLRPVAVAQRFFSGAQDVRDKKIFQAVADHFDNQFGPAAAHQVPVLTRETADHVPANGLVRFRGMVVDMFNPEFFLGAYKTAGGGDTWRPAALFTDDPPADVDAATATAIMERRPLLLAAVPSEQQWATAAWAGKPVEPQTPRAADRVKRSRNPLDTSTTAAAAAAAGDAAMDADAIDAAAADTAAADTAAAPAAVSSFLGHLSTKHHAGQTNVNPNAVSLTLSPSPSPMHPKKKGHRIGAGLSLDKWGGRVSKYDKRQVLEKQKQLKAKQVNIFKRLKRRLEAEGRLAAPVLPQDNVAAVEALDHEEQQQQQQQQQQQHRLPAGHHSSKKRKVALVGPQAAAAAAAGGDDGESDDDVTDDDAPHAVGGTSGSSNDGSSDMGDDSGSDGGSSDAEADGSSEGYQQQHATAPQGQSHKQQRHPQQQQQQQYLHGSQGKPVKQVGSRLQFKQQQHAPHQSNARPEKLLHQQQQDEGGAVGDDHHPHQQQQQQQQQQQGRRGRGSKPPTALQRLADKAAADKARRLQEQQERESARVAREHQVAAKQKQRSHAKHNFLRRTKTGQPVMKVRLDKILETLQAEKGQQGRQQQQQGKQRQWH